jgi:hypothetical protein
MNRSSIRALFYAAAVYDGVLGILLLVLPWRLYDAYGVTPPNHWAYVQFPACLIFIFGLMFLAVARDPAGNRSLIPYGILLKAAYSGTVIAYWLRQGIPQMWKPFALADLLFGVLFAWAYLSIPGISNRTRAA